MHRYAGHHNPFHSGEHPELERYGVHQEAAEPDDQMHSSDDQEAAERGDQMHSSDDQGAEQPVGQEQQPQARHPQLADEVYRVEVQQDAELHESHHGQARAERIGWIRPNPMAQTGPRGLTVQPEFLRRQLGLQQLAEPTFQRQALLAPQRLVLLALQQPLQLVLQRQARPVLHRQARQPCRLPFSQEPS